MSGRHQPVRADDADFAIGIAALDNKATRAGLFALSGASSVPTISAAAVAALSTGLSEIILIDKSILPGNRAPRGRSVMASILHQAGAPLAIWRGGKWRQHVGWTDARKIWLAPGLTRWASLIGAPDLKLFPPAFQARSVLFRAGLELPLMHWGLTIIAQLRAIGLLPNPSAAVGLFLAIAQRFERFGSDRGGMIVEVTGVSDGRTVRRRWQLLAEQGAGPFVPAIPALAIADKQDIAPGARPCIRDLQLTEIEDKMDGLPITISRSEEPAPSFFEDILRER